MTEKTVWHETLLSIQPRIRLTRSFDQRSHSFLGNALRVQGTIGDDERAFTIGIGKAAHTKHPFRAGDVVSGKAEPVADDRMESVEFYKASGLKLIQRPADVGPCSPSWLGIPPELTVYRERGHRRLDARTYEAKCRHCIWGCRMPVEMIIDQWNPGQKRYQFETYCYDPKSCSLYRAGPTRKVPGRVRSRFSTSIRIPLESGVHARRQIASRTTFCFPEGHSSSGRGHRSLLDTARPPVRRVCSCVEHSL